MVDIGPPRFVDMAEQLGIGEGRLQPVCAAILGTENTNMVELSTVYATFARNGVRVDPVMVTRIDNPDGTQLYQYAETSTRTVLNKTVNTQLTWALSTVMQGTGWRAALEDRPSAGKTGTAQNNADATFAGFTPQRVAAVWVGFPDEQIPMATQFGGEKVQGGTFPAMIWHEIMTDAHQGLEILDFPSPPVSSTTTTLPEIPEEAEVPDLTGQEMTEDVVMTLQDEPNYWIIRQVFVQTRDFEIGKVFNQIPQPGQLVPGGSVITVEVAVEPILPPVPSLIGLNEATAVQVLTNAEFAFEIVYESNPDAENSTVGSVWAQTPEAGTPRDAVETVTLRIEPNLDSGDDSG